MIKDMKFYNGTTLDFPCQARLDQNYKNNEYKAIIPITSTFFKYKGKDYSCDKYFFIEVL